MSSIDQKPILVDAEETILQLADKALGDSLEDGNFDFAGEVVRQYQSMSRASEMGVSKILHGVNYYWCDLGHEEEETFFTWSARATGYVPLTIERHISVWEMLSGDYIPEQYRPQIKSHTIRQLFKIYSLAVVPKKTETRYEFLESGYLMDDDDWLALSEASDERRTGDIVLEIKGKERNKNFMSLKIDGKGDIVVYQGNEQESVGFLNIGSESTLVHKAIRRIMDGAGITMKEG